MAKDYNISVTVKYPKGKLDSLVTKSLGKALDAAGEHMVGVVQDNITPYTRTGRLRASIQKSVEGQTVRIGTNVEYAPYVEYGTKPHKILPRYKKALAWPATGQTAAGLGRGPQGTKKKSGSLTVRKSVNHPGSKPRHFMKKAFDEHKDEARDLIERLLNQQLG